MRRMIMRVAVSAVIVLTCSCAVFAQSAITVSVDQPGAKIADTLFGVFFEDINFGADGGLYAERVKNRSFEFDDPMMGWTTLGGGGTAVVVMKQPYDEKNPRALRVTVPEGGQLGVSNEGYRGMGIQQGRSYWFSVFARNVDSPAMGLRVTVVGPDGSKLMDGGIENISGDWKNYTCRMQAKATEAKAKLNVTVSGTGSVDLDMVSLFPVDTAQMNGRPTPGFRKDMVRMLSDLKPGFLRFPGGCIVEGMTLANRYQWKNTIGDINQRKTIINRWNLEFKHRLTPDYYQSFGIGFYEYFLLSEMIGAEPMPIINCGMSCQFNTGQTAAVDKLWPYVQDALDLIEFANGSASSRWGRVRAEMGHPEPFNMKYLGVGNEQWGPQYIDRYKVFAKALKEKYPKIQLIAATGSDPAIFPNGYKEVEYLWDQWRKLNPDIVDEHFYRPPDWFIENASRYDSYDRNGPKLFVGEYAAVSRSVGNPDNRNNLRCALAEAAFMAGMERNADLVVMSAYAPLSAHVDGWQWKPDLMWFDNLTVYATPNYYAQQLFSINKGEVLLPVEYTSPDDALHVSAVCDGDDVIVKVVNPTGQTVETSVSLQGVSAVRSGTVTVLAGGPQDENSIDEPTKIAPVTESFKADGATFGYPFKPWSLTVLRVETK